MHKFVIIIPTYNNFNTIQNVVNDCLEHHYNVIVVDDGSSKPLHRVLEKNDRLLIERHEINQGKGVAITTGIKKAKALGYTHVISMDGDGQHLASQAPLLQTACQGDEIIIGARNFDIANIPNGSKFGRWFSNFWACWDTGHTITDSLSGFRVYPVSILDLNIKTFRFDWEMEVIVRHADANKIIKEVVVECYYPKAHERVSHFRKFWDTAAIVWVHVQILPFKWLRYALKKLGLKN
jgi:glycosyltransferase involved in cell wall biosynthesis